jgi:hypothetical protein
MASPAYGQPSPWPNQTIPAPPVVVPACGQYSHEQATPWPVHSVSSAAHGQPNNRQHRPSWHRPLQTDHGRTIAWSAVACLAQPTARIAHGRTRPWAPGLRRPCPRPAQIMMSLAHGQHRPWTYQIIPSAAQGWPVTAQACPWSAQTMTLPAQALATPDHGQPSPWRAQHMASPVHIQPSP